MKTKAIIFDKDGTLLDFDDFWLPITYSAIEDILKEVKKEDIEIEEILLALGVEDGITKINGILCYGTYSQMGQVIFNILKKYGCNLSVDEVIRLTIDSYHRNFQKGNVKSTCDNIADVLKKLKELGLKLAVVTTDAPFFTQRCLEELNISHFFDFVYTDDGVMPAKPDPHCIYDFCEKVGIFESEVIMVGDTLTDIHFAHNGGIKVIGVAKSEINRKLLEKEANAVISDISYIFEVLE